MSFEYRHGWVPVQFIIKSGEISFRWMDFSSVDIAEPFFRQTVKKMVTLGNKTETSTVQDLIRIGSSLAPIRPACLIFHVSRCGSTLLTNALRGSRNCVALSEPKIITDLFHFCPELPSPVQELKDSILQSVMNLYAAYQGTQQNIVIKLASWNLLNLHAFQRVWPETPCILLIRDPREVIISNLKPGGWLAFRSDPTCASRLLERGEMEVAQMSDIEFCACVIQRLMNGALAGIDSKWMVIDYNAFDADLMPAILEFIGFNKLTVDWNAVQSAFRVYSKDENGIAVFEDDRAAKRSLADQLMTGSAGELSTASYSSLLRLAVAKPSAAGSEAKLGLMT
jgi:hypothetical protein